ncbi:MAG: FliG C-terminal domain-containing protein [Pseudomonadota bacterium]
MTDMVPFGQISEPPALPGMGGVGGSPLGLSRRAKAAIVVRMLINEGADIPLEELPEELQESLTKQMGQMRLVDRDTLSSVIAEFAEEVDRVGLSFSGGIAGALTALDGKISRHTAERLRKEAGVRQLGDPWKRLVDMGVDKLLPVMERESVEIAAVTLSKLPVPMAAELLGRLPGPKARQITYAVSLTSSVSPDAVDRIGLSLASQLDAAPPTAFEGPAAERVGAILNSSTTLTRDDVLTGLDETDQGFADEVRKAIFTFGNIPARIAPRDIPRVIREVDQEVLLKALGGCETAGFGASRDFVLENMSARMADQLREEIEEQGKVKPADAEEAMAAVVATIRDMEGRGDLLLVVEEDETD